MTLFFGGWLFPFGSTRRPGRPDLVLAKLMVFVTFFIWLRATLPRLRYDQLMSFGWKVLLPLATLNAARHRDPRGGGAQMTLVARARIRSPSSARPSRAPRGGTYRAFGVTLRGLKTTFARVVEGVHTIQYPE